MTQIKWWISWEVCLSSLTALYTQDWDGEWWADMQEITIKAHSPESDEPFYTIETERWAFDSPEELQNLLTDFKSKMPFI